MATTAPTPAVGIAKTRRSFPAVDAAARDLGDLAVVVGFAYLAPDAATTAMVRRMFGHAVLGLAAGSTYLVHGGCYCVATVSHPRSQ